MILLPWPLQKRKTGEKTLQILLIAQTGGAYCLLSLQFLGLLNGDVVSTQEF